jgi:hypothetical protein
MLCLFAHGFVTCIETMYSSSIRSSFHVIQSLWQENIFDPRVPATRLRADFMRRLEEVRLQQFTDEFINKLKLEVLRLKDLPDLPSTGTTSASAYNDAAKQK